jgi:hypothetical protein
VVTRGTMADKLRVVLRHWKSVAHQPGLPSLAPEALYLSLLDRAVAGRQAVTAARCVVLAAYAARDAVVHEDPSVSRDVVARFTADWLGLRPTDAPGGRSSCRTHNVGLAFGAGPRFRPFPRRGVRTRRSRRP